MSCRDWAKGYITLTLNFLQFPSPSPSLSFQHTHRRRTGRSAEADRWHHGSNAITDRVLYRLERFYGRSQEVEAGLGHFQPTNFAQSSRRQSLQKSNTQSRRFGSKHGLHMSERGSRFQSMLAQKAYNLGHNLGVSRGSAGLALARGVPSAVTDFSTVRSGRDARRQRRDDLQDALMRETHDHERRRERRRR